jgi:HEAT repeat protein
VHVALGGIGRVGYVRPVRRWATALASVALLALLPGLAWRGERARWLRQIESDDATARIAAVRALARLRGDDAEAAIAHALGDAVVDVRLEAAAACAALRASRCAVPLRDWLDDADADVRAAAARALGRVGGDGDDALLARALGDTRAEVRRAAAQGLSAMAGNGVVRALVLGLADSDPLVREIAAEGLGAATGAERGLAASALSPRVRDEAPEVRAAALEALGRLGDARAPLAAVSALDDEAEDVRLAALATLGRVPSALALPALIEASRDDGRLGRAALSALAASDEVAALAPLVSALDRPAVAHTAEEALAARAGRSEASRVAVVHALGAALGSAGTRERAVRLGASASAIASTVSIAGLEGALSEALATFDAPVLLDALGRTGSESALVPLLDALGRDAADAREAALAGLEGFAARHPLDGRALDPIVLASASLDAGGRARAIALVGGIEGERADAWLAAQLDREERLVRVAALGALVQREAAPPIDRLLALVDAPDAEVRMLAARVLGRGGDARAAAALATRIVGRAPADRTALLFALGPIVQRLSEPERAASREALRAALSATDPELADAAALAIATSRDETLARELAPTLSGRGASEAARILRALAGTSSGEVRAAVLARLADPDAVVATTALATLAVIGGPEEGRAIAAAAPSLRFPRAAAAAFALAHMARRGVITLADVRAGLMALAASHDPYTRANVAIALAALRAPLEGQRPLAWAAPSMPPLVRAAAVRWAHALAEPADAAALAELEAHCAGDPSQPELASVCAQPALPEGRAEAFVVAIGREGAPLAERLVALRFADGSALVTYTDARGRVRLSEAPAGRVTLEAPESTVLAP